MFCTDCGSQLRDSAKFCGGCGQPVGPDDEPTITGIDASADLSQSAPTDDAPTRVTENGSILGLLDGNAVRIEIKEYQLELRVVDSAKVQTYRYASLIDASTSLDDGSVGLRLRSSYRSLAIESIEGANPSDLVSDIRGRIAAAKIRTANMHSPPLQRAVGQNRHRSAQTVGPTRRGPKLGGWTIMVVLFGWLGGGIGYFSLKASDRVRADHIMKWGLIWTALWVSISVIMYLILVSVIWSSLPN